MSDTLTKPADTRCKCGRRTKVAVDGVWLCRRCRAGIPRERWTSPNSKPRPPSFATPEGRQNIVPAPPGNERALKHGATSPRRWRPIADQLAASLPNDAPWAAQDAYAPAVAAWSRVEAQLSLVSTWLDEVGALDDDGNPRPAAAYAASLEARAQSLRDDLGLSPDALGRVLCRFGAAFEHGFSPKDKAGPLGAIAREFNHGEDEDNELVRWLVAGDPDFEPSFMRPEDDETGDDAAGVPRPGPATTNLVRGSDAAGPQGATASGTGTSGPPVPGTAHDPNGGPPDHLTGPTAETWPDSPGSAYGGTN